MSDNKQIGGDHYRRAKIQPWDLTRNMETSGSAHVDGCRFAIIKYAFRRKGDAHKMIEDLRKAAHYAEEAARALEAAEAAKHQPELPLGAGNDDDEELAAVQMGESDKALKSINGHRCRESVVPTCEGLMICVDCLKAERELDEPCTATNGGA